MIIKNKNFTSLILRDTYGRRRNPLSTATKSDVGFKYDYITENLYANMLTIWHLLGIRHRIECYNKLVNIEEK